MEEISSAHRLVVFIVKTELMTLMEELNGIGNGIGRVKRGKERGHAL